MNLINGILFFLISAFLYSQSPKWFRRLYIFLFFVSILLLYASSIELNNPNIHEETVISGVDKKGNNVVFKVQILNDKFSWKLGNEEIIQLNGEDVDVSNYFNSPEYLNEFVDAQYIICVGNSSHEGRKEKEVERAKRRGEKLAEIISKSLPNKIEKIKNLNLGINLKSNSESSYQRRLIVILVLKSKKIANIQDALQNALLQNEILPFSIKNYSNFDLK